ncbi:MAG TPA: hydroxymethylglutaryl-CoA reductase, degradative [Anaerolineaceae bacterium]|nr:hydroxymethylglutaryl-CoA reductase, degradative [Anaerolineaceae bacterium]
MTKKFYKMTLSERREFLLQNSSLTEDDLKAWLPASGLTLETADHMIENAVGVFSLPLGIAQNFVVNGRSVLVPMVVEEPSVVAAVSYMAKLAQSGGGFKAWMSSQEMIGQVQLLDLADVDAAQNLIETHKLDLLQQASALNPGLTRHGGGIRELEVRRISESQIGSFLVVHLILDVADAMGANMVNTAVESLAPWLEELTGGRAHLRILSNLSDRRLATAEVTLPVEVLAFEEFSGEQVRDGVIEAWAFAEADPYRAATHNKGIMNGVDAVLLATGNDWRAVEAGAHAFAARGGRYTSLSTWSKTDDGSLKGSLTLPLAIGIVGGATRVHPGAKTNLQLMGVEHAKDLGEIIAAVGLAQNLAALRALATEGIQKGHMSLHARQVALAAGAKDDQVELLAQALIESGKITTSQATRILEQWNGTDHGKNSKS